ncbi:MAG: HAD family hydrolase [Treponema sp.]|jgi:phosphoglycolate phosphatase/putative hydrolase of the HAD superfamily|nr:HAD family hydrolase [Treponema sp.]
MKIYTIPDTLEALIFDMDGTLYTHPEYVRFQIDRLIQELAARRCAGFTETAEAIEAYRKNWAESHNNQQVSLGNVFKAFGVSIEESIRWREELYHPEAYLKADPKLQKTLRTLKASYKLAVVTNNPVLVAQKTLSVLGVEDCFTAIVGLDTCKVSKPHSAPFLKAAGWCGVSPETCVALGDRYDIDVSLPLRLGMGGVQVDGVEDVYLLGDRLMNLRQSN